MSEVKEKKAESQVRCWDMTLWQPLEAQPAVAAALRQLADKYAFQYEQGEVKEGKHFQIKLYRRKKCYGKTIMKAVVGTVLEKGHLTKSSTKSGEKFNYQMKLIGRLAGPWTDEQQEQENHIPRDLLDKKLYPWQATLKEVCLTEKDTRYVHVIYDGTGNLGKSWIARLADAEGWAGWIPPYDNAKDMLQAVYGTGSRAAYIVDCPRGKNTKSIWMGIESIKNGVIIDARHHFKKRRMDIPVVWVFTNQPIDKNMLANDRWRVYNIINKHLVELPKET